LRLRGERLLRHVVRTPDVYLVPRADGELVIGATMEDRGFDLANLAGGVLDMLTDAARVLSDVRELDLVECCVGFRPALRDHLPAIGATAQPGVFVATGHFRDGVLLSPITARLLADVICDGRQDPLLAPFGVARFERVEALS
jgi:glycine oxidase